MNNLSGTDEKSKSGTELDLDPDPDPSSYQETAAKRKRQEDTGTRTAWTAGDAWEFDRIVEVAPANDGQLMYKIAWQPTWGSIHDFESDEAVEAARRAVISTFGTQAWESEFRVIGG